MNEIDDKKFVINVNYMYILKYVQWLIVKRCALSKHNIIYKI